MSRSRAWFAGAFPLLLTLGIALIPLVVDYSGHDEATLAVAGHPLRWASGHLVCALAFGVGVLAAGSIAASLPDPVHCGRAGGGAALMALGAVLHAAGLGADGIGPVALQLGGGDPRTFFEGSGALVSGTFMAGALLFGLGQIVWILHVSSDLAWSAGPRRCILVAAIAFSAAEAIPSGVGLYVVAAASMAVYVPVAFGELRRGRSASAKGGAQ